MKKRILIVDDEEEVLQYIIRKVLMRYNAIYEVLVSTDGYDALSYVKSKGIDALVLDLEMRNMGGLEVCRVMHDEGRLDSIPVIISSGSITPERAVYLRELGVKHFLEKPYKIRELFETLESVLT